MRHEQASTRLPDLLEDRDDAALLAHVRECPDCQRQLFLLSFLVQRLAPHLHRWNRSVVFSIERLREEVGWRPEFTFESAVEHTYAWFRRERLHETARFDWSWEDQLLRLIESRGGGVGQGPEHRPQTRPTSA